MTYKNLIELKEQRPQLIKRLLNWGLQRKNKYGFKNLEDLHKQQIVIEAEVEQYLEELVFTPTKRSQADNSLIKWFKILTPKERQTVGLLIKYDFKEGYPYIPLTGDTSLELHSWYDGEYKVLDEKVLDIINYQSKDVGLITENSYGAAILNADNMLIIDIDTFGDISTEVAIYPEQAIAALKVLESKQGLNFRIYETAGGLRAIETTKSWNPTSWDTSRLMKSVYGDPLYIALCRNQETFRARLTPKPWRLWNYIDYDEFTTGQEWLASTQESEVGVCKLIIEGTGNIDDKFKPIIDYHDTATKALLIDKLDLGLV